jgi:glycosyltransferase involved in cell wall biosynthesis
VTSSNGYRLTVAIDTWPLLTRFRNTGIYVYAKNLLSYFREMGARDSVQVRPLISPAVPNDAREFEANDGFQPYHASLLRIGRIWRYGGACISALNSKANMLFCPSGTTLPLGGLVPVVATIHDVTPVVFPSFPERLARGLRFAFANTAKFSRAIITDSEYSKCDLMKVYGLPDSRVHVIYLGCNASLFNSDPPPAELRSALRARFGLHRPYIFHHGTIQPRKNLQRLIEAYRLALSRNRNLDFDLVLSGDVGWQYEETLAAAKRDTGNSRVLLTGPLGDVELSVLLKGASLAVVPSLYEGFCLPLLEAMACGTPTICSNSSCLPEISGGVLKYFDPLSLEEMAASIEMVLDDSSVREILSAKGKERASYFSWRRCAEETMTVFKTVAAN